MSKPFVHFDALRLTAGVIIALTPKAQVLGGKFGDRERELLIHLFNNKPFEFHNKRKKGSTNYVDCYL